EIRSAPSIADGALSRPSVAVLLGHVPGNITGQVGAMRPQRERPIARAHLAQRTRVAVTRPHQEVVLQRQQPFADRAKRRAQVLRARGTAWAAREERVAGK